MARLGSVDISNIKRKILEDLYQASENRLDKRKKEIAQKNREYVMAPLENILSQIPDKLLNKEATYELNINYKTSTLNPDLGLQDIWLYKSSSGGITNPPIEYGYGRKEGDKNLVPELYNVASKLCDDIINLRDEKKELEEYLDTTTHSYTGSLQLRKIWPPSLHKYLPAEIAKPRRPRKLSIKTKVQSPSGKEISAPTFIKHRLTTNLLEKD